MAEADGGDGVAPGSTSFYPPPPAVFRRFTEENLLWLEVLRRERASAPADWDAVSLEERRAMQHGLLERGLGKSDVAGAELPDFDLQLALEPPNVQWVEQDGGYQLFGQRWPIPETTPTLEELGIPRMFPRDPFDRNEALQVLLRTLLQTYFELTSDLLRPVQPYDVWLPAPGGPSGPPGPDAPGGGAPGGGSPDGAPAPGPDGAPAAQGGYWVTSTRIKDRLKHVENTVINTQYLINQLRPVQARATLEMLLQAQIDRRRREAQLLRRRSAAIREELARIDMG